MNGKPCPVLDSLLVLLVPISKADHGCPEDVTVGGRVHIFNLANSALSHRGAASRRLIVQHEISLQFFPSRRGTSRDSEAPPGYVGQGYPRLVIALVDIGLETLEFH